MRTVGEYVLGAAIGHGATSEVLAATDRDGREVALKLLRAHLFDDPRAVERFLAEAERTRGIAHPNVVTVLEAGRGYLAMERIHGETLAERLARGPMAEAAVRTLGAAVADGMAAAHARTIVHRDLKPANIMLDGDTPKIVDFGIATTLAEASARTTGTRLGTPAYMAPEQLSGGVIAPCVDVWALGVILFEAVTGKLPFDGFDDGRCPQLLASAPAASTYATISAELDRVIAMCLEREPGKRPASMIDVASMLRGEQPERITQAIGEPHPQANVEPAEPKRPTAPRRRRWPWLVVAAALAAPAVWFAVAQSSRPTRTTLPILMTVTAPVPAVTTVVIKPEPVTSAAAAATTAPSVAPTPHRHHPSARAKTPRRAGETLD
jgi:eukaryotic-like serine/threonine-protein kinase